MFGTILGSIGGSIGGAFGGGILSTIGRFAGKWLGNYLDNQNYDPIEHYSIKNLKDSFNLSTAVYGDTIPLVFGTVKVDGKIIWSSQVKETSATNHEKKYFSGSKQVKAIDHTTEYTYSISMAISICEGTIAEIGRVWANGELIDLGKYKFRLHLGSEDQAPDPLISESCNAGKAPAFRDLAYLVLEELPLENFNDVIPNFSFEVTRKANIEQAGSSVEDLVKSIAMIPGSGEFVYDTVIQHKIVKTEAEGFLIAKEAINSHNFHNLPNSVHSLNQLKVVCENTEWIAPVVCWFGDTDNSGTCNILPGVEFKDENTTTSEEWRVGRYSRMNARLISRDSSHNPRYGGSVNDASVVRYLQELRTRKYKIMLYPMFFMDIERKPWRGHLTGDAASISAFFNKDTGYNNFILHYAQLVKGLVDCFIIGSELIGLTKVKDQRGAFPAIAELIGLAKRVKEILGPQTLVTYAADWSEYHHTEGGWYNLDPLWACPYIDFIGIDAYFPVTRTTSSDISKDDIINGWKSGEGYDYYIDSESQKQPLSPEYAWKNLEHWWSTTHRNPDGEITAWKPKMKQIWFTEFGFPSIDKATNQPNVFFDPLCRDGGVPTYSSGDVDFSIQRKAIRAFIEYWESQEYIGRMFLWTWDARPYPAWPHMNVWRDGYLWEKGHWVNNKFGASTLAGIILEISNKCCLNLNNIDVSELDDSIEGVKFDTKLTAFNAINILRISHFFDLITSSTDKIRFIKRGFKPCHVLSGDNLVKISENNYLVKHEVAREKIISRIELYFLDRLNEYIYGQTFTNSEVFSNEKNVSIHLPIVMSWIEAEKLCKLILQNALNEDQIVKFIIPASFIYHEPTDFIKLKFLNYIYNIRITSIKVNGLTIEVIGIFDDSKSYYLPRAKNKEVLEYHKPQIFKLIVLDLPPIFTSNADEAYVISYLQGTNKESLHASLNGDLDQNYNKIATVDSGAVIGVVHFINNAAQSNIFIVDELSTFTIFCSDLSDKISNDWNLALCGNEIIQFKKCRKIRDDLYEISYLIRGNFATEEFIRLHRPGEHFILLGSKPNLIPVSSKLENKDIYFKTDNSDKQLLHFENKSQKLLPPFVKHSNILDNILNMKWCMRTTALDDWISTDAEEKYKFHIIVSSSNKAHEFVTEEYHLTKKIDDLGLSGPLNISIIAKGKDSSSLIKRVL